VQSSAYPRRDRAARFYCESDASSLLKITLEQTARYCGNLRSACCPTAERSAHPGARAPLRSQPRDLCQPPMIVIARGVTRVPAVIGNTGVRRCRYAPANRLDKRVRAFVSTLSTSIRLARCSSLAAGDGRILRRHGTNDSEGSPIPDTWKSGSEKSVRPSVRPSARLPVCPLIRKSLPLGFFGAPGRARRV